MGKEAGFRDEELRDFAGCSYCMITLIHEELSRGIMSQDLSAQLANITDSGASKLNKHCIIGERNIRLMPFRTVDNMF